MKSKLSQLKDDILMTIKPDIWQQLVTVMIDASSCDTLGLNGIKSLVGPEPTWWTSKYAKDCPRTAQTIYENKEVKCNNKKVAKLIKVRNRFKEICKSNNITPEMAHEFIKEASHKYTVKFIGPPLDTCQFYLVLFSLGSYDPRLQEIRRAVDYNLKGVKPEELQKETFAKQIAEI